MSLSTVAQCPLKMQLNQQRSDGIVNGNGMDERDPSGHQDVDWVRVKAFGA